MGKFTPNKVIYNKNIKRMGHLSMKSRMRYLFVKKLRTNCQKYSIFTTHREQQWRNGRLLLVMHKRKERRQMSLLSTGREQTSRREYHTVNAAKAAERHENRYQPGNRTEHAITEGLQRQQQSKAVVNKVSWLGVRAFLRNIWTSKLIDHLVPQQQQAMSASHCAERQRNRPSSLEHRWRSPMAWQSRLLVASFYAH